MVFAAGSPGRFFVVPELVRAKLAIEQVLFDDPLRTWTCSELAVMLGLTSRTISQEVRQLREEDKVERVYGKRKRMVFRAKVEVAYPRWMERITLEDVSHILVSSIHRHTTDDGEW